MDISLVVKSKEDIKGIWPKESLITIDEQGINLHVDKNLPYAQVLLKIQEGAKNIANKGFGNIKLTNSDYFTWDDEAIFAFDKGYFGIKNKFTFNPEFQKDEYALTSKVIHWVRNTINAPADVLNPVTYQDYLKKLSEIVNNKAFKVTDITNREGEDFIGIKTVGKGSSVPPRIYEIDYNPSLNDNEQTFASLVGKGITFDSGGLSLKPSEYMKSMHSDMGGSATIAGAIALCAVKGFNKRVKGYLCCAENMISGSSMKIGDVIHYPNNVSVEIANTDAEGRLVLADGLILATKDNPKYIIDAATLTGAAKVAVGRDYNAVLSFNNDLTSSFIKSAKEVYEYAWPLPLEEFHKGMCRSDLADITNSAQGESLPGATTAAVFLSKFVKNEENWLHIDLSGSYQKASNACYNVGAKGHGVRSIERFLENLE